MKATYKKIKLCILGATDNNSSYCYTSTFIKSDRMKKNSKTLVYSTKLKMLIENIKLDYLVYLDYHFVF